MRQLQTITKRKTERGCKRSISFAPDFNTIKVWKKAIGEIDESKRKQHNKSKKVKVKRLRPLRNLILNKIKAPNFFVSLEMI